MFKTGLTIKSYIFLFFILAVVVPASIIGYLSYVNGQNSITTVLTSNSDYEVKTIKESLSQFLTQSQRANDLVKKLFESDLITLDNRAYAGKVLMNLLKNTESVPAIEYADDNNELIGAYRGIWNRDFSMRIIGKQTDYASLIYEIDENLNIKKNVKEETIPNYDVRVSLPYKKAKETNKASWTSIFLWPSKDFGIDFVSPVEKEGKFVGVVDVSMNLAFINSFVEQLKIYPNTQVFIIEKNGLLVSGTNVELATATESGKPSQRVLAGESNNSVLKDAVKYIESKRGGLANIKKDENSFVRLDNKDYFLTTANFKDDFGIDWVILIAKLRDDYMGELARNARSEGYLIVILTLLALIGAWLFARYITTPLIKLVDLSKLLAEGNLKMDWEINRNDEMGVLARSFKIMAEKINAYINSLKELDKLKDDFLSVATHELKSPLMPIKAQSQLLLAGDYGKLNKKQKDAVEMIYRNEEGLSRLTDEVFDIAKVKSKKINLIKEMVAIEELVSDSVQEMDRAIKQKNLELVMAPIPKLPKIMIDRFRIGQVMRNLLDNAIKFTPEHGKIEVKIENKGKSIDVSVKDTGIGIDTKNLDKLFAPFYQIESDWQRKYRGAGLGLAVAKGIAEAHGGSAWVRSEGLGKGSTFGFSLPISDNV